MENKCSECGKCFGSTYNLKRHKTIHREDAKMYSCPICSKTFNRNHNLTRHLNLHTQERKFLCDICYRPFNDYSCVKKHRLSHFPPSKYTCEYCGQKFNRRSNLRVHLVSKHLGIKLKRTWQDVLDSGPEQDDNKAKPDISETIVVTNESIGKNSDFIGTTNENIGTTNENIGTTNENIGTTNENIGTTSNENIGTTNENIGKTNANIGRTEVTGGSHEHDTIVYSKRETKLKIEKMSSACEENVAMDDLLHEYEIKVELADGSDEEISLDNQAEKSRTNSIDPSVIMAAVESGEASPNCEKSEKSNTYSVEPVDRTTDCSANGELKIRLVNGNAANEEVSCWQCSVCQKVLSCKSHLKLHIERHAAIRKYSCDHCTKSFKTKDDLQKHQKTYLNPLRLECEYCKKIFNKHVNLKRHLRLHTGERPYHCFTCNQSFSDATNFKNHKWKHADQNPWHCDKCNKTYSSKKSLEVHVCTNPDLADKDNYKCDICQKKYSSSESLRSHRSSHTRKVTRKTLECQLCRQKFKWQTRYESHLVGHVREEEEKQAQRERLQQGMTELANIARKENEINDSKQSTHGLFSSQTNAAAKSTGQDSHSINDKTGKAGVCKLCVTSDKMCSSESCIEIEPLETESQADALDDKMSARYDNHLIKCIISEEDIVTGEGKV